jgi:hypothetical protein
MIYTRLCFWLHPRGLTVAPSLFMHLTGLNRASTRLWLGV